MKYKYEDFETLEQARNVLQEKLDNKEINNEKYVKSLLSSINKELDCKEEHIETCNNFIHEVVDILNNNYLGMVCPLCNEEHIIYKDINGTALYICQDCPMIMFEYIDEKDTNNLINYLGGGKEKKPLWKLQEDYLEELEIRTQKVEYDNITIKELLELGFNNNYLQTSFNGEIELGYVDENGNLETDLNEEQLNVKVKRKQQYYMEDGVSYTIMSVVCVNEEDERLFIKEA